MDKPEEQEKNCEACGWPLQPNQDCLCSECALELAKYDAEASARRFEEVRLANENMPPHG